MRSSNRTVGSEGCLSNKTALAMIFKLGAAAEKRWRRLDGYNQLPKIKPSPDSAIARYLEPEPT